MNTTDKVIIRFKSRVPKMLYTAHYNGLLIGSGSEAQQLGETYARRYRAEWLLQDGDKFYSQKGLVK